MTKRQPYRVQRNAARAALRACRAKLATLRAAARLVAKHWHRTDLEEEVRALARAIANAKA